MLLSTHAFVLRQTKASEFSHFDGTWDELVSLTVENWANQRAGYRDGVVLVTVPADKFYSATVELNEKMVMDMRLQAQFKARKSDEEPVAGIVLFGEKQPARFVDIVCYRADVLAEDNDRTSEADWEIISINAALIPEEPMNPVAMARNFLHKTGGTKGSYSETEWANAVWFWATHVKVGPIV